MIFLKFNIFGSRGRRAELVKLIDSRISTVVISSWHMDLLPNERGETIQVWDVRNEVHFRHSVFHIWVTWEKAPPVVKPLCMEIKGLSLYAEKFSLRKENDQFVFLWL